jgi:hypothetical protein
LKKTKIDINSLTPYKTLFHTATLISLEDRVFRWGVFEQWLRKHKSMTNQIKRNPELTGLILDCNNQLKILRSKHRTHKGFM